MQSEPARRANQYRLHLSICVCISGTATANGISVRQPGQPDECAI